jgi:hypothetical protein
MPTKTWLVIGVVTAAGLAIIASGIEFGAGMAPPPAVADQSGPIATARPAAPPTVDAANRTSNKEVPGVPAIKPTLLSAGPNSPTFSNQDAINYATTHPFHARSSTPVSVTAVEFIAASQIKARFGWDSGLADDRLLCMVRLEGAFQVDSIPGRPAQTGRVFYQFFDAHTGNLLINSGGV